MKTESDLPSYEHPFAPARDDNVLIDEGLRQHILRVYGYMGIGLVVTGLVAVVVATAPVLYVPISSTPLKWVAILAPLAFAFLVDLRAQSMSASTAQTLFWSFCAIMGLSLAAIFLIFAGTSVARTFFIAAAMFAAMGLYGYTTHRDLSAMGAFIVMGLVGVLMASLGSRAETGRKSAKSTAEEAMAAMESTMSCGCCWNSSTLPSTETKSSTEKER
jgi:FtsH-binding integral membrane protein